MSPVRMTHEGVDDYYADPLQVPHLRAAGWEVAPDQDETGDTWPADLQRFEGQPQVRMRHPHPDVDGEITVAESAVPYHREKGWQVIDPEAEATAGLEDKTVPELRDLAKARGISPLPTTKPELVEALSNTQQDDAGDEPASDSEEE